MIEAVNSVVANASTLRVSAEVLSAARAPADNAPAIQVGETSVAELPKAPYISPYIVIDRSYNRAVLQIRDSDTGDVVQQFPTRSRLAQLMRAQEAVSRKETVTQAITGNSHGSEGATQATVSVTPKQERLVQSDITAIQENTVKQPTSAPSQAIAAFSDTIQAVQSVQQPATGNVSVLA